MAAQDDHLHSAAGVISRALSALEGKPDQELAAFHRLKAVFVKFDQQTQGGGGGGGGGGHNPSTDSALLAALAEAITKEDYSPDEACKVVPDVSLSSSSSSAATALTCPTRRFGRTELQMPIITCGGMRMQQTWRPAEGFSMADVQAECQQNFEAIVARALELGINHFETALGYGCSELQYGQALKAHPRDAYILQSKVRPFKDPEEFKKALDGTLERLDTHLDLFAFHGINRPEHLEWIVRPGGCLAVVREYQSLGKIRFIGFSTHAPTPLIVKAIETGIFDYVNLHYHFIGSYTSSGTSGNLNTGPGNLGAIEAAHRQDMGVFIISPNDKGGMLYRPPQALVRLCSPVSPLIFNDVWLWNLHGTHEIHTLVVGAARPSDFDEAMAAVRLWTEAQQDEAQASTLREIEAKLVKAEREVWGEEWADDWWMGLSNCYQNQYGVHVSMVVWLWAITKAYGLHRFSAKQYSNMEGQAAAWEEHQGLSLEERVAKVFDWTPGVPYNPAKGKQDLTPYLPPNRAERLLCILREAHYWFGKETAEKVELDQREKEGWADAYDLQVDVPFPEREQ